MSGVLACSNPIQHTPTPCMWLLIANRASTLAACTQTRQWSTALIVLLFLDYLHEGGMNNGKKMGGILSGRMRVASLVNSLFALISSKSLSFPCF